MIRKLKIKFVIINMTMVTAMLCVIFGLIFHFTRENLEVRSISMMKNIADDPFHRGAPNEAAGLKLPYFTLQVGPMGELISTGGGYYDLSNRDFLNSLVTESINSEKNIGVIHEHNLRFYRADTPRGNVLVFADMSNEADTLNSLLKDSLIIGCFSFVAFLFISIFLSGWAIRPVAKAWEQQKQFIADASHELKTPLTVITTNAELLQDEDCAREDISRFSLGILTMSRQMRNLVEKMLELSRAEEQNKLALDHLDMSRLATERTLSFEGVFLENGLPFSSSIDEDIYTKGNEEALGQVMDILLDNAAKYSLSPGEVHVSLKRSGQKKLLLSVSNCGTEIPREELDNIFRRFYRSDKVRSRDGSFGLGLSIAQSIVQQHKGRIWAQSVDGINTFNVELKRV